MNYITTAWLLGFECSAVVCRFTPKMSVALIVAAETLDEDLLVMRFCSPVVDALTLAGLASGACVESDESTDSHHSLVDQVRSVVSGYPNVRRLVWDLSGLHYVDLFGWEAIVGSAEAAAVKVAFAAADPGFRTLTLLNGMEGVFPFFDSVEEAHSQWAAA